jgi:transposase-like protein
MTMSGRNRHTPEQVVRKLAEADRLLGEGVDVVAVCRELQVTEATYYRWRTSRHHIDDQNATPPSKEQLPNQPTE